jgi:hypothetical protein
MKSNIKNYNSSSSRLEEQTVGGSGYSGPDPDPNLKDGRL